MENMRLLICDDSKTIRLLVRDALSKIGESDVTEVENGQLAVDAIRSGSYDCLLLDLHMPVMDGLTALRTLKEDHATMGVPVVIISSDSDMRNIEQARQLGALGFIRKPFKPEGLRKALDAALGKA
jgi:two-component system, chemotaxis family, chemotaxis protein CheY